MTNGVLHMDDNERAWLQRELDDIKGRIDSKPCVVHGEELSAIRQHIANGDTLQTAKRDWFKIFISVGMLTLAGAMAFMAFGKPG